MTIDGATVEATHDYDASTQINRSTWFVTTAGRSYSFPLHLRAIFPQELPLLLAASGLRLVHRHGDLDGSAFTSGSVRQVCVWELSRAQR